MRPVTQSNTSLAGIETVTRAMELGIAPGQAAGDDEQHNRYLQLTCWHGDSK